MTPFVLFTGNSNRELADKVRQKLAIPLGKAQVSKFSDGEINVEIQENVRGKDVFVLQSICAPTNTNLMELLLICDALKRSSAARITAVVPYFGYARQDRRVRSSRVPISAKVVADTIQSVGMHRVLTMDLHAEQIQGFFSIPVDNVYGSLVIHSDIRQNRNLVKPIVVSPDVGGVVRARALAKQLDDMELAIIDKRRQQANESQVMHIIGDVQGRSCVVPDDIVDTASTLCNAAKALKDKGALRVVAYCTHPVLSGGALKTIENSVLDELVVTDTIPLAKAARACGKIRQVSIAPTLAEAIRRVTNEESLSAMF